MRKFSPYILCLQETKLAVVDGSLCKSIWSDSNAVFSFSPSRGASGGLVTVWDSTQVEVWTSFQFDHVLGIQGRFVRSGKEFTVFNVYAPCDSHGQHTLWHNISSRLAALIGTNFCVCGDFNTIRSMEERRSVGTVSNHAGTASFNMFIDMNQLIDLPLRGHCFTWFRGDGKSMSRLDRFLLSEDWCISWPNCFQLASQRGLSDHCPIQLCSDEENWGPRPLRMLKCWETFTGYKEFVREKWCGYQVEGWGGYVLKEKLKFIKLALKEWHRCHAKNLPSKITNLKDAINGLELKAESVVLLDEEVEELHGYTEELFSLSRINSSISWQQSRMQWL